MKMTLLAPLGALAALIMTVQPATAQSGSGQPVAATATDVVVRVISQDAKFVGDLTGGAEVRLVDAASGTLLAEGIVRGSTGDTDRIMAATGRAPPRATEGSAAFRATVAIDRPTLVRVEVRGPLGVPQTMQRATSERWLVPGQAAIGTDGWVIELPGLAIRMLTALPATARRETALPLAAHVQLMCGCPITPGGMWDAADYVVTAEIRQTGAAALRVPMTFSAAPGEYRALWTPDAPGPAELFITAYNRRTGNAGVLREHVQVE